MENILIRPNQRVRKSFAKLKCPIEIPNLIDIQRESYAKFLQYEAAPDKRLHQGLQTVFSSVFPIHDFNGTASLEFESYSFEKPKYDVDECRARRMTYAAPIKITVRLVVWDVDEATGARNIRDVKVQEVYLGEIPLMTETGSFIVNGTERVVVSQLHRSPGVFYDHDAGATHASGKLLYNARVIPYRGSWLDFEFDHKDLIYVRIDRRRKMPGTVLLKALGMDNQKILDVYYKRETIRIEDDGTYSKVIDWDLLPLQRAEVDIEIPKTKKLLVRKGKRFGKLIIEKLKEAKLKDYPIDESVVIGKVTAAPLVDKKSGEIIVELNEKLTQETLEKLRSKGVSDFEVLFIDGLYEGGFVSDTLRIDRIDSQDEALIEIYKRLRPGDPPTIEASRALFENLFFNSARYDLSKVGRLKINHKFAFDLSIEDVTLRQEDIIEILRYLVDLRNGRGQVDDIDHLGNRRVRPVGELLENQFRVGLVRMERAIRERMSLQEIDTLMPYDLINAKPISAVVKEFFGSSQLSQFMDQTNPLSEVTHKRRLSALGPGGLTRERAGFEVRDVHPTHYGRICPIETPEGPNIGLISSLSTYARVNTYGFVETPYAEVKDGKLTSNIRYYSALEEERHVIAQANTEIDKNGKLLVHEFVQARKNGETTLVPRNEVDLMDVSPTQLVSVAAALIPFLENDDANRALMGSNMQRQAVPLIRTAAPLVGTGMEFRVAADSGVTVVAKNSGTVYSVDANRIVVLADDKSKTEFGTGIDVYRLVKYRRSNQNTCFNQKPIVRVGQFINKGEVLADGPATETGELALGQNVMVAFMPWQGYNFEDSILVSERIWQDDVFTSVHIEEFEVVSRDTKLGKEEITRDIPNVGEEALRNLDSAGIIRIGAEVNPGDILVGKVTPKGETQLSPEEKLLRAIFGEKAGDVKDTSLRVGPGVYGTVIDAQVFSREGADKDERSLKIIDDAEHTLRRDLQTEVQILTEGTTRQLAEVIGKQKTTGALVSEDGSTTLIAKGDDVTEEKLRSVPFALLRHIPFPDELEARVSRICDAAEERLTLVRSVFQDKIDKLRRGDELPPGVIKMVKVYVAIKRKLKVGDKMAGRHGNKGVVSRVLPVEDMPYMADGSPVDIVLNPLGVPSRMNVGQILETHLGWAARGIGECISRFLEENSPEKEMKQYLKSIWDSPTVTKHIDELTGDELHKLMRRLSTGFHMETHPFDRASEEDIERYLKLAGLPTVAQTTLFDGRTGDAFEHPVTVGMMYMLKLHHLVDEKIHARSIGPYSLVTQQPLGGKTQFGGQRLGEMEVWAMEAYGASYALQEFLTVKSDDVAGRTRMYEAIVKGENVLEPGLPESFNVLVKELQGLALDVELIEDPNH